jgi:4-hydroxyphenylpyruvate dioxygenase-like putative hemolysin
MGTDGFEFVEYTGPDPLALAALFERMGFVAAARHRSKSVTLYQQGDVNFILNAEPARSRFASPMLPRLIGARSRSAPSRSRAKSGRWN